jgi:hypothetical protein
MAKTDDVARVRIPANAKGFEFEFDEEQRSAVADCIRRSGKLTLRLTRVGVSRLPGRGLLDDVDGELID